MGWKGKEQFEVFGMLIGALGLIVLFAGFMLTPDYGTNQKTAYIYSAALNIGSILVALGVTGFFLGRLRTQTP